MVSLDSLTAGCTRPNRGSCDNEPESDSTRPQSPALRNRGRADNLDKDQAEASHSQAPGVASPAGDVHLQSAYHFQVFS